MGRSTILYLSFLVTALAMAAPCSAQPAPKSGGGAYALEEGERNLKFAGVPIPNYSDVLGVSLGVVGMAYYKLDREDDQCPPSSTGLMGFYSENNTWIGAAFQKIHYDQDKWRGILGLGLGSVKYQFNPSSVGPDLPDMFLDYTTVTDFLFVEGSRLAWRKLYLGAGFTSWSAQVAVEPDILDTENENYAGPVLNAEWDATNHVFQPTTGFALKSRFFIYDGAFGADRDFTKLNASLTGYHEMGDTTRVLAGRLLVESGFGDVPFSGQAIVNGNRNLRGYSNGRYRADQLAVIESEYRWNFHGRWGATAFAGLAFSNDEVTRMNINDVLPASGLGLRFLMIKQYRINARVDYGWGKHDQGVYVSIGEAY